jgi:putative hydrolase of the HAD superfamily
MTCAVHCNLDGTLTENTVDFEDIYSTALDRAGIIGLDGTYEAYTDRFFNYFQKGWAFPRRQAVLDLLNDHNIDDLGQSDAFGNKWTALEAERTTFHPAATDVLQEIAGKHRVSVITNGTSELQRQKIESMGVRDMLDAIVVSTEIGQRKPNAEFFRTAKETIDVDTHIVVSHDLRRDILPAKRLDMLTVWISDKKASDDQQQQQIAELVDAQIGDLQELPQTVDRLCSE